MLADPRAAALVTNFAQQWLDIRGVRDIVPDPVLFPEYNPDLGIAFARELELFLASVMLEDRSVLELLSAQAHVLERAARAALRRAGRARRQLPPRRARGREPLGLVRQGRHLDGDFVPEPHGARAARRVDSRSHHGHAARVAAARTSRRSPRRRKASRPKTVRERLEEHRSNPTCNACHGVMDPLGFALENFDAIGAWRVKDREALAADRFLGPARRRHRRQRARRFA